ncbi:MAG: adenosylmethionine--8-amino-7-oxononanoate transaminase [Candidatus Raymondbacteria bacterium RifOxyC12_full_50_8]|uniref:Adenosylmethionine-8-amino-7-oxononanoate aminotransferase n=1 Tax=Candidatus Raymondbacteria bacterium RIFOXYD12_FULL_49_13 TaxID=1817890 RepID=A0A1F7FLP3_UNCRA|nr:MAG: adenosylmethionine--8-amino-7-oxononanoate transaminase [Candidatus Raymondbacteria bacterium RIFOXYA2_FULL_49_16]OGJ96092.1 MAG: adenosylmethionine--8-amino-7-oxononanoate transaminase [Candidatus Raymondbacteria bacterium RIFOXYC2_FULL_50_21]OGJ99583.1 MAG: adenosylmethionine--8-amino-7-oxononanoate transaminase [Candidatus Raymondbacteria bacterium RifOxyB12_full_50_8]OGK03448.1 MAG: adenosylmethionine--8-amino-7-oxononanoate transaminase [Candidatus Raymondbacteria bacterium RifOxyC1
MNTHRSLAHVWYPCSQMKDYETFTPLKIVKARGVYLYDAAGKRYIDAVSSWWVNLFGHCDTGLSRALSSQMKKLEHVIFAGCTHEPALAYAEELLRVAPEGLSRVFFTDNGSSAVEAALKMSFQYWQQQGHARQRFIALTGAYHGETLGALSAGGIKLYRDVFAPMLMKVRFAQAPSCCNCPFGKTPELCGAECFVFLEKALEKEGTDTVAGIIVEPLVQCANRMNMYPAVYLQKLRKLCTREKAHFIADEIAVGFGRTGKMFACDHAAVTPDIMCLSKGITGGWMPFSVVLAMEKIYKAFYAGHAKNRAFLHSHSYSGNALGCALAREVLAIFRRRAIIRNMAPAVSLLGTLLAGLGKIPGVVHMRQTGLIGAFDLVNPTTGRPFDPRKRMGLRVARAAIQRGVFLRPLGDTLYFMPPLTIREKELSTLVKITGTVVRDTV